LIIISPETTAVTLLPWDGSLNARDNSIALAGLDVATGDYAATAGVLRAIARRQDASIEGAGWFAREAYEHVIASGDTALVRGLYPAVLANIAHAAHQHADGDNFLLEDKAGSPGYSSADLQALWYFQQTISSIFASFMADTVNAARWAMQADGTLSAFNRLFVDTTRQVVNPRIAADGRGMDYTLPGPLLCLDVIESEAVRQNTVKGIMKALLRPVGLESPPVPGATGNGIIYNWMAGQMVYALTRYDCQHISYPITRRLADRILTTDMVGALPEMYEANGEARALGSQASLAAMAEFIRSFYQDYLGVHINMTTQSLALEPKLPDEIDNVDFTIFAGDHPISARYERKPESDHVVLRGEGFSDSLRVTFLWMMKSGDAWRGATALYPGRTTTLVFGERDATALIDGKQTPMEGVRHLVGFSQRAQMEGF
jgi:hypothetical protein